MAPRQESHSVGSVTVGDADAAATVESRDPIGAEEPVCLARASAVCILSD
jgi:hypothetical protein